MLASSVAKPRENGITLTLIRWRPALNSASCHGTRYAVVTQQRHVSPAEFPAYNFRQQERVIKLGVVRNQDHTSAALSVATTAVAIFLSHPCVQGPRRRRRRGCSLPVYPGQPA